MSGTTKYVKRLGNLNKRMAMKPMIKHDNSSLTPLLHERINLAGAPDLWRYGQTEEKEGILRGQSVT